MKLLTVDRRRISTRDLKFRIPSLEGLDVVRESCQVLVDGDTALAFTVLPSVPNEMSEACQFIEYQETARTDGLVTRSRTFGFLPRVTLRRDFCTATSMKREFPREHSIFARFAREASRVYSRANPARFAQQEARLTGVLPDWRIAGSVFTSGIVNKNNALRYHLDAGNFPDGWSAMYAFSLDCGGGDLAIPELGLAFSFQRPALIMFDGARLLHGVTPLELRSKVGYRYSIVFYAMKGLCNCLPQEQELARIRRVKSRREVDRAAGKKVAE